MTEKKPRHQAVQAAIEAWAAHVRRERDRKALIDDVMRQLRANADARAEREAGRAIESLRRSIGSR